MDHTLIRLTSKKLSHFIVHKLRPIAFSKAAIPKAGMMKPWTMAKKSKDMSTNTSYAFGIDPSIDVDTIKDCQGEEILSCVGLHINITQLIAADTLVFPNGDRLHLSPRKTNGTELDSDLSHHSVAYHGVKNDIEEEAIITYRFNIRSLQGP